MSGNVLFRAAALAAILAFVGALALAVLGLTGPQDVLLQPSYPPAAADEILRASRDYPALTLRFFAADSLFVLSYLMVFAGLFGLTAGRSRTLAAIGLGAGVLAALFDATENAYFVSYALLAEGSAPLPEPGGMALFIIANLKWMAAFATLYAFGLAFPRHDLLGRVISALMLLFPLYGVLSIAVPALGLWRGLFFLVGMPLFAIYFWRAARASASDGA
jgi:hypothetical protein